MQVDDEAMLLEVSDLGIVEVSTKVLVLRFPLKSGDEWSWTDPWAKKAPSRAFRVISVGLPCAANERKFTDCAIVEDSDQQTRIRTVTTYAKGVGPVEYQYFKLTGGSRKGAIQNVMLKAYHLVE